MSWLTDIFEILEVETGEFRLESCYISFDNTKTQWLNMSETQRLIIIRNLEIIPPNNII